MNIEEIRDYCLHLAFTTECMPFDDETLVFKVLGKMFCVVSLEGDLKLALKYDPEKAIELRERFSAVRPGYHFNKKYWNTVSVNGTIDHQLLKEWIDDSYQEVIKKLPKKEQQLFQSN
ncbi:MAG: MmcQ/YjbR family DNA-binding protein [Bacteroidales bacterium]|nr:MmcQ/YjbR family DNA-binding protein [Bacteroidales bacterium]